MQTKRVQGTNKNVCIIFHLGRRENRLKTVCKKVGPNSNSSEQVVETFRVSVAPCSAVLFRASAAAAGAYLHLIPNAQRLPRFPNYPRKTPRAIP
eukprot:4362533-Amphidinium_carterae.1